MTSVELRSEWKEVEQRYPKHMDDLTGIIDDSWSELSMDYP